MIEFIKKYKYLLIIILLLIILGMYMLLRGEEKMNLEVNLEVKSSAFINGGRIPIKYTGIGEDISIPLKFGTIDTKGKSIVIIMDDPDAPFGTFTHWMIWNIPTSITSIPEGISHDLVVNTLDGAIQGKNDFGTIGYKGPNPPSGTHNYRIKVYVLDRLLEINNNISKKELESVMKDYIIQYGLLEGKFSK